MQKEIQNSTGEDVETLYLAYMNSGNRDSPVNSSQWRQNSKPRFETCTKTISTGSSPTFPTVATWEGS